MKSDRSGMSPPPRSITIRDVAQRAGLSKTTVSDALRNEGRVTIKTRKRVQALARKMGYVPNTLAAALASSKGVKPVKSLQVAFVTDFPPHEYNDHRFLQTRKYLKNLGYEAGWFDLSHEGLTPASLRHLLYHRGYRGIIFGEVRTSRSELFTVDWDPFCVACEGRTWFQTPFDIVRTDPFKTVITAWNKITAAGYSRIGFMFGRHSPRLLDDFEREGALAVLQGDLPDGAYAIPPYFGDREDMHAIKKWMLFHRPDAVVSFNTYFLALLENFEPKLLRNVGLASFHGEGNIGDYAFVDNGDAQIPEICADYIDQLIRHNRIGAPKRPREILAPVSWVPGASLPGDPELRK